ncbi:MAG TPA: DNA alkylation repair protein, partial [Candidatus Thermoplasmatota archaeon]|nr:DNA alkylation repair protein [Candidatus Thermoplasmatota archaeon]
MAEQLKSAFGPQRVARIADEFAQAWPAFPKAAFLGQVLEGFDDVGLMDRCRRVADALAATLPTGFPDAVQVVLRTLGPPLEGGDGHGMEGFHYLPHSLFLSIRGLAHPDLALEAMRHVTSRSSCEFAIRPFLEQHQGQTLRVLHAWTQDPDEHVRRLVSEGTRPRLPWATRLTAFQQDPSPNLGLLEKLRDDPSPYVRRSVANHLNDIAKDHPDVAIATCRRWLQDASADRRRLVHHALRSLARS